MGRKKVIYDAKKTQVSVSLSNLMVERIDSMTSRRSRWIRKAIQEKFDARKGLTTVESKTLVAILINRVEDDLDLLELLYRVRDKLPDSGV
jgi:metal-responsive CopG/Arc/MetJ family transcriptional regulator